MIYFDSSALLKFVKPEKESEALRTWRLALEPGVELVASRLTALEISRTLLRAGASRVELLAWARVIPSSQRP